MPASGRRLAIGLTWQLAQQLRNRLLPRAPVARSPAARAALLEAAEVYERLYVLDFYANRRAETIHEAVKGLNLAEAAGSEAAVARLTVVCGVSVGFLPLHRVARSYIQQALTAAGEGTDPRVRAWVLQFAALYGIGMGQWAQATARLEEAAAIMRQFEDRRRLGEINVLRSCVAYAQGDLGRTAALLEELRRYADQSHDAQLQAWALIAQATTAARSVDPDQAALLLQGRRAPALQALLHLRQGDWQAAREAVQVALASARVAPIKCYWLDLYATTAEAAIALWHASRQRSPGEQATARAAAGQAMRSLRRDAHVFPIGQPRALLCQGLLAWVQGRPVGARKAWRRSLAAAERLGMRYDQLLAHQQLGRHGDPRERREHLNRARQLFTELGIGGELAGLETLAAHLP
jgi:tetratricopeptide (TPR) repeat protein